MPRKLHVDDCSRKPKYMFCFSAANYTLKLKALNKAAAHGIRWISLNITSSDCWVHVSLSYPPLVASHKMPLDPRSRAVLWDLSAIRVWPTPLNSGQDQKLSAILTTTKSRSCAIALVSLDVVSSPIFLFFNSDQSTISRHTNIGYSGKIDQMWALIHVIVKFTHTS